MIAESAAGSWRFEGARRHLLVGRGCLARAAALLEAGSWERTAGNWPGDVSRARSGGAPPPPRRTSFSPAGRMRPYAFGM